ncbi:MAG: T9SS type A sorting domain-containing protein [Bacteroidetes bacterium]|nr:T9SS type A sorting domain-containing protein [Bacteroidota bacterium]
MRKYLPFIFILAFPLISSAQFWTQTSGVAGGNLSAMAIDASGNMFVSHYIHVSKPGNTDVKVYKLLNGNISWSLMSHNGLIKGAAQFINTLVLHPSNGDVYAGTSIRGVLKYTTGSNQWTPINTGLSDTLTRCIANSQAGDSVFAATGTGVYLYVVSSSSWIAHNGGLTNVKARTAFRNNAGDIFVGTDSSASTSGGIFKYNRMLHTWSSQSVPGLSTVGAFGGAPSGTLMVAGTRSSLPNITGKIYKSTGTSWILLATAGFPNDNVRSITVNNAGDIFAATDNSGVFRLLNGGSSWTAINTGIIGMKSRKIQALQNNNIIMTTSGGIYVSSNNGATWTPLNYNIHGTSTYDMALNSAGEILAATTTNGIFKTGDKGVTWTQSGLMDVNIKSLDKNVNGDLYAGSEVTTGTASVYRSTDNGATWNVCGSGLAGTVVWGLAHNSNGDEYASTGYTPKPVFLMSNNSNCAPWTTPESTVIPSNFAMTIGINKKNEIYIGTENQVIMKSINGITFTPVYTVTGDMFDIAFNSKGVVFMALSASNNGVVRSKDSTGTTWLPAVASLSLPVFCLAVTSKDTIYAGTNNGVYFSSDTAKTWTSINSGLTNLDINSLFINPNDGFLYAGTGGDGVFRSSSPVQSVPVGITENALVSDKLIIFPNPVSEILIIKFKDGSRINNITLYNLVGEKIESGEAILNEKEFSLNMKNVASGVYLIKAMDARGVSSVKKIIVDHH